MAKTVLITGGNRGLGRALVDHFLTQNWQVITTTRNKSSVTGQPNLRVFELDLAQEASIEACAQAILATGQSIDLLINNAGFNPKDSPDNDYFQSTFHLERFSARAVAESVFINALAPTQFTARLLPVLSAQAIVINISSWLGSIGNKTCPGHYGYAGSKALLNMITRGIALEWENTGRSCVAVNPGWMQTDMGGDNADKTPQLVAREIEHLYTSGQLARSNGQFLNSNGSLHPW